MPSSSTANIASSSSNNNNGSGSASLLFNPDEVRFMDDSLSNADSFDPFTIGAPGFKVPNVLPANLGGMGAVPRGSGSVEMSSPGKIMSTWSDNGSRNQTYNSYPPPPPQEQHQKQQSSSNSHSPNPLRGGYGRDKAWQMQQLEALQAEREKYQLSQKQMGMTTDQVGTQLSAMPDFTNSARPGHSLSSFDNEQSWLRQHDPSLQIQPDQQHLYSAQPSFAQSGHDLHYPTPHQFAEQRKSIPSTSNNSSQDLGHLGLRFPSSHQFPIAARDDESSSKRQRRGNGEEMNREEEGFDFSRGRSPNARPPWTLPPNVAEIQPGSSYLGAVPSSSTSSSSYQTASPVKKAFGKKDARDIRTDEQQSSGGAAGERGFMTIDMDAPYTYLPAPKPPTSIVDVNKAQGKSNAIPSNLRDAFFSPRLGRYQPHLLLLREEQMKRKEMGLSANIRKGDKKVHATNKAEGSPDGIDVDGEKKKAGHTLLTEAEKKANHIASEQKRRANIRKGYEMLCDLVPALQEDGEEGNNESNAMGLDDEGEDNDEEFKKGKRRRGYEANGGDRIEGRTGPRSEAAILMAAVEHLRNQLEVHKDLVVKKQEAQLRVAQKYGLDVRVDTSSLEGKK